MAKQAGPFYFIGTIDDITFYKQGGEYYIKRTSTCSETTKKKYKTDPGYALLRMRKNQFGTASKLVQEIYYTHLPKAVRKHKLFGNLTGMVNTWFQQGKSKEEALQLLIAHCAKLVAASTTSVNSGANEVATEKPVEQDWEPRRYCNQGAVQQIGSTQSEGINEKGDVQQARLVHHTNKPKRKGRNVNRNLSEWQVQEKGKLVREAAIQPPGVSILHKGCVSNGYCDPCRYTGLLYSVNAKGK